MLIVTPELKAYQSKMFVIFNLKKEDEIWKIVAYDADDFEFCLLECHENEYQKIKAQYLSMLNKISADKILELKKIPHFI